MFTLLFSLVTLQHRYVATLMNRERSELLTRAKRVNDVKREALNE